MSEFRLQIVTPDGLMFEQPRAMSAYFRTTAIMPLPFP